MNTPSDAEVLSVSQLNREARLLLETGLATVWVTGEMSNVARPASGHIYFSLKDERAQVRCAMFRSSNRRLHFKADEGIQILARAKVSLYEPRGDYQLIVEHMEEAGEGLLRRRFDELKARLADEGLFDETHKLDLPAVPRRIGIITSPSGAAVRDVLHVLGRRFPMAAVVVYPTRVQGRGAKEEIAAALMTAGRRAECDVLILARGGGSLEDLWAFNEELVARSIHACHIPIVSGIGHEIDFTIADLVADLRAPTPSGAAELVAPDRDEWLRVLQAQQQRAVAALRRVMRTTRQELRQLEARLTRCHPGASLRQLHQQLDDLTRKLVSELRNQISETGWQIDSYRARLRSVSPAAALKQRSERLAGIRFRLLNAIRIRMNTIANRLAISAASLQAVSPLATLERGYSIVQDERSDRVIRDADEVQAGDRIRARLARGHLLAIVEKTRSD